MSFHNIISTWHRASLPKGTKDVFNIIIPWVEANIEGLYYYNGLPDLFVEYNWIYFENESDRTLFILTWKFED